MNTKELRTILGYLNMGLAIAHNRGVSIGHFGSTDFVQLAETVNDILLHAVSPAGTNDSVISPATAIVAAAVVTSASPAAKVAVGT